MRRLGVVLAAVLATVLLGVPAYAQGSGTDTLQVNAADTTTLPEVHVPVVAPQTLATTSLTDQKLAVSEAGVPRPVQVQRLPGGEQDIVLAVDVSGGMSGAALDDVKRGQ